jgi:hypothetical protein
MAIIQGTLKAATKKIQEKKRERERVNIRQGNFYKSS